ncbi:MAG: hypothetical protein ACFBWO_04650 [Paracoccaceae bacterium]
MYSPLADPERLAVYAPSEMEGAEALAHRLRTLTALECLGLADAQALKRWADDALNHGVYDDALLSIRCEASVFWQDHEAHWLVLARRCRIVVDAKDAALWLIGLLADRAMHDVARAPDALIAIYDLFVVEMDWDFPLTWENGLDELFDAYCEMDEPPQVHVPLERRGPFARAAFRRWLDRHGARAEAAITVDLSRLARL